MDKDLDHFEQAMRAFFQTLKKPQRWAQITQSAGVVVDRPAAMVLLTLVRHEPTQLRVHDLALQLGIEPPSVTRKTQELEHAGYLERVPDPLDRRAVGFHVTKAGRKITDRLHKAQRESLKIALADWSAKDRQQFIKYLERFSADLNSKGK